MKPVSDLTIVGGGTAGWMCAAALANRFASKGLKITLVESDEIGTVGVGEATIPHIRFFNQALGIDEREFMAATSATFKLGIQFSDWGFQGNRYIHPFGAFGFKADELDFQHWWLSAGGGNSHQSLFDYSFSVEMARQHKFRRPSGGHGIADSYSYAYHLDASAYAAFLRKYSEKRGVRRVEGKVVGINRHPDSGEIKELVLADGLKISGEFFVDCTGFSGLLIGKTLGAGFESWKEVLPCDRAVAIPSEGNNVDLPPYTESIAQPAGWSWRIPLQHRTGNGYVFCSEFMDDQSAIETLSRSLAGSALAAPKTLRFEAGRRKVFWVKNCVAVGLSAGFLEPLESTSIYLIQAAIMKFIELFPGVAANDARKQEFNRYCLNEYETVKDFLILHYWANRRSDSEFWRHCRNTSVPDSLSEKIELFKRAALLPEYEHGIFKGASWLSVFVGQGIVPEGGHPSSEAVASDLVKKRLASLRHEIKALVAPVPLHRDYLESYVAKMHSESDGAPRRSIQ